MNYSVIDRFLNYVTIDTQSNASSDTCPSTEKQKNLGNVLVKELKHMRIKDAEMDENGYVYATLESNSSKNVAVICFCAHLDTAPDCSGANVHPVLHKNYDGKNITLPKATKVVISTEEYPELIQQTGKDIITTDGTTLLGADDKAGIAEIMDAISYLINHPEIKHGTIKILFTPDEEIGRGADKANLKKLGADFAYTIDGGEMGQIDDETFSADSVTITVHGVSTHPGTTKGMMENAIKIASEIICQLPKKELSPETTEKKEGFIHPHIMNAQLETATITLLIRDYNNKGLAEKEILLKKIVDNVFTHYPKSHYDWKVTEQYRNMKEVLDQHPQVVENAVLAMKKAGIEYKLHNARGGTDGSRFSFMGLPCPNIFTGGYAAHSKKEWASVYEMGKAVETIVNIAMIWEERAVK